MKVQFLRRAIQVASGQLFQQVLFFLRNVFVARLLPPEEFGIALTLMTIISAVDAISELGMELYLVRSKSFDDPKLQETLQAVLLIKAVCSAAIILMMAKPLSLLFNVPDAVNSYQLLSIIPLLRGLLHLDIKRFERHLKYWPGIAAQLGSAVSGLVAAIMFSHFNSDHTAMLASYMAQYTCLVTMSHLLAERRYSIRVNSDHLHKMLVFGTPLLANGALLFVVGQGDRALVASHFGMQDLAIYGTAAVLTTGIIGLVMRTAGQLYLPILSGLSRDDQTFMRRYELCGVLSAMLALICLVVTVLLGSIIVELTFGPTYSTSSVILAWLGIQISFRTLRSWPQYGQLSLGNSKSVLFGNVVASFSLGLAAATVFMGYGIVAVAMSFAAGELLSLIYIISRGNIVRSAEIRFSAILVLLSIAALSLFENGISAQGAPVALAMGAGILVLGALLLFASSAPLRQLFMTFYKRKIVP